MDGTGWIWQMEMAAAERKRNAHQHRRYVRDRRLNNASQGDGNTREIEEADDPFRASLLERAQEAINLAITGWSPRQLAVYQLRFAIHPPMTQADVAKALCVERQAVGYWEKKILDDLRDRLFDPQAPPL